MNGGNENSLNFCIVDTNVNEDGIVNELKCLEVDLSLYICVSL